MNPLATFVRAIRARTSGVIEQDGVRIPADDPNVKGRVREVMLQGVYEQGDVRSLAELLRPDDVVMEIGGGIGFVSALAAKRVGSDRVHTYEPNPAMEASIRRLYALNDVQPSLTMAAMSDRNGSVCISVPEDYWDARVGEDGGTVEVPAVRFADALAQVQPTVIMMDCEGSEDRLLGPIELPPSVRAVIAELHPELIGLPACNGVIRSMLDQGFLLRFELCGGSLWTFVRDA